MAERASLDEPATGDPVRLTTNDFDYAFDEKLIAQRPLPHREASRMLVVRRSGPSLEDLRFTDLPDLVEPGDVLVLNDTRVFPARLRGRKPTGAVAEILLLEPLSPDRARWRAMVRPGGKLKPGRIVEVAEDLKVGIEASLEGGARAVRLISELPPDEVIERHGHVPLPPYIQREDDERDRERYQTVYANTPGSVAAPTAGLHFSESLIDTLRRAGVAIARVTLHVGPGTFRPVEANDPSTHRMDPEWYRVTPEAARTINRARAGGGAVWAVGTTAVRTLETACDADGRIEPREGKTDLFIRPGYRFRAVDRLITNFHLPRSTLLMLVAAIAGYDLTMTAYRHAIDRGYRFYSYGDSMVVM